MDFMTPPSFDPSNIDVWKYRMSMYLKTLGLLCSCTGLRFLSTGSQVHGAAIKLGLDLDVSVSNSLLTMYGECGSISECWKAFHSMPDYDQISWNSMIGMLAKSEESPDRSIGGFLRYDAMRMET